MSKVPFISETVYWGLAKTSGFIGAGEDGLEIEYQMSDTLVQFFKTEVKDIEIPYESIQSIHFKKGWWFFSGKLIIELNSLKNLGRIPFLEENEIVFKIRSKNRELARVFSVNSQLELSTSQLNKI